MSLSFNEMTSFRLHHIELLNTYNRPCLLELGRQGQIRRCKGASIAPIRRFFFDISVDGSSDHSHVKRDLYSQNSSHNRYSTLGILFHYRVVHDIKYDLVHTDRYAEYQRLAYKHVHVHHSTEGIRLMRLSFRT